jgi:hypothetical protein
VQPGDDPVVVDLVLVSNDSVPDEEVQDEAGVSRYELAIVQGFLGFRNEIQPDIGHHVRPDLQVVDILGLGADWSGLAAAL